MMYNDSGNSWGWILMIVTMIALLGVVTIAGIALYRHMAAPTPIRTDEPSRILAERFARGEIDESEFVDDLRRLRTHNQD
jgi:putative membrane protein